MKINNLNKNNNKLSLENLLLSKNIKNEEMAKKYFKQNNISDYIYSLHYFPKTMQKSFTIEFKNSKINQNTIDFIKKYMSIAKPLKYHGKPYKVLLLSGNVVFGDFEYFIAFSESSLWTVFKTTDWSYIVPVHEAKTIEDLIKKIEKKHCY